MSVGWVGLSAQTTHGQRPQSVPKLNELDAAPQGSSAASLLFLLG